MVHYLDEFGYHKKKIFPDHMNNIDKDVLYGEYMA